MSDDYRHNPEYLEERLWALEGILKLFMEVFAETATPNQLGNLDNIGSASNKRYDELKAKYTTEKKA